jgi:hypothetical protein
MLSLKKEDMSELLAIVSMLIGWLLSDANFSSKGMDFASIKLPDAPTDSKKIKSNKTGRTM